jgi:transcriptional regulator with XRE-family HTH domain
MEPQNQGLPRPSSFVPEFTLGDRLRRAREACGYTQTELADLIGISQRSVSSYEADDTVPNLMTLRLWALFSQVSEPWLAFGDATATAPMPATWKTRKPRATRSPTIWKQRRHLRSIPSGNALVAIES